MEAVYKLFLDGAWGENARINNRANGGPDCAQEIPLWFVFLTIAIVVSLN